MGRNKTGFINVTVIILVIAAIGIAGYLLLAKKQKPAAEKLTGLTKESVLNGYDQCGVQFKTGRFTLEKADYEKLDAERAKTAGPGYDARRDGCGMSAEFFAYNIQFADLDSDGLKEALVPARVVRASSGGVIYIFKNFKNIARVVDRIVFGVANGKIDYIEGNAITVEASGAMGYTPTQETYKFVNGKLIKQ